MKGSGQLLVCKASFKRLNFLDQERHSWLVFWLYKTTTEWEYDFEENGKMIVCTFTTSIILYCINLVWGSEWFSATATCLEDDVTAPQSIAEHDTNVAAETTVVKDEREQNPNLRMKMRNSPIIVPRYIFHM
jgi:hypothetical protein